MRYFNYIFISGYRVYLGRNTNPKFTAVMLVTSCIIPIFALILICLKKFLNLDGVPNYFIKHIILFLFIFAGIAALLYSYYSEKRITNLMERFDDKSKWERMVWGSITVISLILPWVLFAITLNSMHKNG